MIGDLHDATKTDPAFEIATGEAPLALRKELNGDKAVIKM